MATPIWQEKEKRWTLRIKENGKETKFSSSKQGIAGKKEVLRKAREYMDKGIISSPTVAQEWSKYLEDVEARSSEDNYISIEKIGRLYILPLVSNKKLDRITLVDWQNIINKARKQNGEMLAKKTYSNIRGTITNFLNFCYRDRVIDYQPVGLYVPKNTEVVGKQILQPDQIKMLFDDTQPFADDWYLNYFKLLMITGARNGEVLALKWSDIDFNIVSIKRSLNSRRTITEGKNKNAKRSFILPPIGLEILADQKRKTDHLNSEWIFCTQIGTLPTQSMTYKHWMRIAEVLKTDACIYSFRHTFVSLMKSSTISDHVLKSVIGHSESMSTFETYGHEVKGEKEELANAVQSKITSII